MRPHCMSMILPVLSNDRRSSSNQFHFSRKARSLRVAILSGAAGFAFISTAASADCTADSTGTTVTCTGSSTGYSNLSSDVSLSTQTGSTVTGPILLGNSADVLNDGALSSSTTEPLLQVGTNSVILNNGSIESTSTTSGSAAVLMGDGGTFTNDGTLTAETGTTVIQFGQQGTFINNSSATAAVTGNIDFGPNVSGGTSSLFNYNTQYGIVGNIYSTGNTILDNDGLLTGSFVQTPTGGSVAFTNDTLGVFSGSLEIGDTTTLINNGSLTLTSASNVGSAKLGVSSFTNNGTLSVGTTTPTELVVNGSFVNAPSGVINLAVVSAGAAAPVAGTTYSQIYATGPNGTATLGGTLNIVPTAGFYPTGVTYNVILADQSITGNFATVNGKTLPFISFIPVGIVNVGTGYAYEVEAVRSGTYAQAIASVATPNQLAIATALQPLVNTANGDTTSTAATLIGDIDLLTIPQTQTLLDQISPIGYLGLSQAMVDQVNLFDRQVMLRTLDPTYDDAQSGWWIQGQDQFHVGTTSPDGLDEGILGMTAGFDTSGKHWRAGGALSYSTATVTNGLASLKGHNQAYIVGGYAGYHVGPFSLTGQVDYDIGKVSSTKTLSLAYTTTTTAATSTTAATTTTTATNTDVTGGRGDHLFKGTATLGVDLLTGGLKATPFVGVDYARGAVNGFTESGGGAADLTVSELSIDRTDVLAGFNLTTTTGAFRPYLRAMYRSQISGSSNSSVSAFFNGDPTTAFTVYGSEIGKSEGDIDAGVNIVDDEDAMTIFVGYQGTIRNQMSDHGVMAGVRVGL